MALDNLKILKEVADLSDQNDDDKFFGEALENNAQKIIEQIRSRLQNSKYREIFKCAAEDIAKKENITEQEINVLIY